MNTIGVEEEENSTTYKGGVKQMDYLTEVLCITSIKMENGKMKNTTLVDLMKSIDKNNISWKCKDCYSNTSLPYSIEILMDSDDSISRSIFVFTFLCKTCDFRYSIEIPYGVVYQDYVRWVENNKRSIDEIKWFILLIYGYYWKSETKKIQVRGRVDKIEKILQEMVLCEKTSKMKGVKKWIMKKMILST